MMVTTLHERKSPFGLVVSGEAEAWRPALEQIVGSQWLTTYLVRSDHELLGLVEAGMADAAVIDESADWRLDVLHLLRMIRRLDALLPVVVVTSRTDRRWLEGALRLTAFSVLARLAVSAVICKQAETFLPFRGLPFANRLRIAARTGISLSAQRIRFLPSAASDKPATSYFIF